MASAAALILTVLDKHLRGPANLRLMGGAALTLAYDLDRATEDADLLLDDAEAQFLAEERDFGEALERTNRELEPLGLYISHIWGPEQQILTPEWRSSCRHVPSPPGVQRLTLEALGPLDLIASKLARADDGDLSDIAHLVTHEGLSAAEVEAAIDRALVPPILRDVFERSRPRLSALLDSLRSGAID